MLWQEREGEALPAIAKGRYGGADTDAAPTPSASASSVLRMPRRLTRARLPPRTQVESLVGAQQRLRNAVVGEAPGAATVEPSAGLRAQATAALFGVSPALGGPALSPPLSPSGRAAGGKVAHLRELLGAAVRAQSEQTQVSSDGVGRAWLGR